MKTSIVSLALVAILSVGAFANPRLSNKSKAKAAPAKVATVEQQISSQLTYPDALANATRSSVVIVQYKITEDSRVSDVQVLTANKQLNSEITAQMRGLRVNSSALDPQQVYTTRLRFQVD
jgi:outer membrane biosynthesis protein TonB